MRGSNQQLVIFLNYERDSALKHSLATTEFSKDVLFQGLLILMKALCLLKYCAEKWVQYHYEFFLSFFSCLVGFLAGNALFSSKVSFKWGAGGEPSHF